MSAAPGRLPRLDPLALPVRFTAPDAVADGRVRLVEIDRERVLLSRSVRGMAIRVRVPVSAFKGVAARAVVAEDGAEVVLSLEHADAALSVDLCAAADEDAAVAAWQLWGRVLGLPLLSIDHSGAVRASNLQERPPAPRRRRHNAIKRRRTKMALRRRAGSLDDQPTIHQGREIIARN